MKSYLQNIKIECWQHVGRLGTNEPSICMYRDNAESCGPLLIAIGEVESGGPPAKRKLMFQPCQRPRECNTLQLILSSESDELRQLQVAVDDGTVTLEVTSRGLQLFKQAVEAWRDGAEDFGLSPTWERSRKRELGTRDLASGELWFWGPYYDGP